MVSIINGSLQEDYSGNIATDGYITGKKSGVFASLDSATATTVTTAGTYYPILGTFTTSTTEFFD